MNLEQLLGDEASSLLDHTSTAFPSDLLTRLLAGKKVQVMASLDSRHTWTYTEDMAATLYHLLGLDPLDEMHTPEGRPIMIANNGRVMKELL